MAVVEQQEMEWTLWGKKERNCMFLYSISHKSTFMQDKSNKYLTTAEIQEIPQKSSLHPDTEQFVWSLFKVTCPKKDFV